MSPVYLLFKLTAIITYGAVNVYNNSNPGDTVITVLAFSCFAIAEYLLSKKMKKDIQAAVCSCVSALICFAVYSDNLIYYLCFAVIYAVEVFSGNKYFWQICCVLTALIYIILRPPFDNTVILAVMLVFFVAIRISVIQLEECRNQLAKGREEAVKLKRKLSGYEEYIKSVKKSSAIEERRRFSARIHDKLGHSISGSIILLEAAKLNINNDPDSAEKCISTAAENLRNGVDEIRKALREERPDSRTIGISELKEILDEFKATYGFKTSLIIKGDADRISFQIWNCIKENLIETLTNTLKHSTADEFSLTISVMNKVIRTEYKDNGGGSDSFTKGTGLTAIEERTVLTDGKCFFLIQPDRFSVINIFNIREENK